MRREPVRRRPTPVAVAALAAVICLAGCGASATPTTNGAQPPDPILTTASQLPTPPGADLPRLSNGVAVAVPTGFTLKPPTSDDTGLQLFSDASVIMIAASNGTDPDVIAANVLTSAQHSGMFTDVREVGTQAYAPTGRATGETMVAYTATLHADDRDVPVEGAAVGIVRDDGKAVRVLWLEPPGMSRQYSSAYRNVLVSLTR